jgi:S-adenosylmethionine synthetase
LLGEVSVSKDHVNFEQVAREVAKGIGFTSDGSGFNCHTCDVIQRIESQSSEIAASVHVDKKDEDLGAGDQGLMFGYATDEWDKEILHPYSHVLAN